MSNLRRLPTRTAVLRGFDPSLLLDLDFRMGSGNDIDNANSRGLRYGLPAPITYSGADNGTYFDGSGVLQTSGADEPRFDHDPTSTAPLGLLIEEARVNHFLNSGTPATQTSGALATGEHTLWMVGTGSVAVAANTATITGAGTATEGSSVTFNVTVGGTVDYTVTGSPTRAQSEKGSFATSYIPTVGSSVTRTADLPTITLSDIPGFSATEGTVYVEYRVPHIASTRIAWNMGPNSTESIRLRGTNSGAKAQLLVVDSTVTQAAPVSVSSVVVGTLQKCVVAFKANDFAISLNGETPVTDTSGTIPTVAGDTLDIGHLDGAAHLNDTIARIVYWNERKTNASLRVIRP